MTSLLRRHAIIGAVGLAVTYLFWLSRPEWVSEMRFWRAVGDTSLILLYMTLALGPIARFLPRAGRLLFYRRELGIWFGLYAILHTVLILEGWMSWDFQQFMGYEFLPPVGRLVRLESGFGMANIIGFVAVLLALPLMATSADWAMRALGGAGWKFLHYTSYTIFYLVVIHTAYFMYIQYTLSFHRQPPPNPNWFQIPFAVLTVIVLILQVAAYVKTVNAKRLRRSRVPVST